MADVITRFKLETTQYDSKLRDAAKGLKEFTHQAQLGGKNFTDFSQKATESARALGTVASGATNTKEKVRDLVGAYNEAAKAYNSLNQTQQQTDFGKNLAASLETLKGRITEAKQELYGLGDAMSKSGGGGLFAGLGDKMSGALQVFGGNLMTKGAGMLAGLASEMGDMVKQGVELAKQGEGIRIAFERLGRGDILQGLRDATHGTVTDIELMKAAVKFNDFKLPLDELGTMLAFAQQKAKDTGQSVDYMVDSIVTGLGRKSLMILDNLGLSATEVRDKMAETGDMTKAVGAIIREQMAKAGDYVETAADRAAQANVSLQNKMEELGRKFAPLEEASNNLWTSMKIGILDVVGGPLTTLLNKLTEAGRLANQYGLLGGKAKVGRMISNLSNAREDRRQGVYQQQVEQFWRYINRRENYMKDRQRWVNNQGNEDLRQHLLSEQKAFGTNNVGDIQNQINAAKQMLAEYQQSAKQILQPIKQEIVPTVAGSTGGGGGGRSSSKKDVTYAADSVAAQQAEVQRLTNLWNEAGADVRDQYLQPIIEAEAKLKQMREDFELAKQQASLKDSIAFPTEQAANDPAIVKKSDSWRDIADIPAFEGFTSPLTELENHLKELIELQNTFGRVSAEAWQGYQQQINETNQKINEFKGNGLDKDGKKIKSSWGDAASAISGVGSALSSIEDPTAKILGIVAQAIAGVAAGAGQAVSAKDTTSSGWAWIGAAAAITASMVAMISQIHSATGYANGGIVRAAGGTVVPGNNYSGDMVPAMLNSGELVLNRAQQGNLASQLEGGSMRNLQLSATIKGEDIRLVLNNNGRRTGRGEYVTTNFT